MDGLGELARPLRDDADLDPLLERIGDARVVAVGEASHGTHEYYAWRAALTRRLVEELGFGLVAVEGDWPDCDRVDRSVRLRPGGAEDPRTALDAIGRWPTWMWALRCFEPFGEDGVEYAFAQRFAPAACEETVVALLSRLCEQRGADGGAGDDADDRFAAEQNAAVVVGAERYYRAMVGGSAESWNVRDVHMADTLDRLVDHTGAKAVVWEHDTHVGDARATDMADAGMTNVGRLLRERHGTGDVVLVGFAGHRGGVIAGREWGAQMERMTVPPAREGSLEDLLHREVGRDALVVVPRGERPDWLDRRLGHRAIGVVYRPERERWGNYVPTVTGDRYGALLYLEETTPLRPLHLERPDEHVPPIAHAV
ncbi:erythromycin esterase family protein [Geodermatophilus sp. SYSU D00684]